MDSYRLRLTLRDSPGALADVTQSLADAGCNVLRVDIQAVDGRRAVDELSVQAPPAITASDLRARITDAGAVPVLVDPLPAETDRDPVTAALDDIARIASAPPGTRTRLLDVALRRQLGADGAWVLPRPRPGTPFFGRETVGSPTVLTIPTASVHARDRTATVLLAPERDAVGVALHWGRWAFSASELARAAALVRTGALLAATPDAGPAPDGPSIADTRLGPVAIRPLVPSDAIHLIDLDLRLSDRSRRFRFNGARGLPAGKDLAVALSPRNGRRTFGAWTSQGLIAEAGYAPLVDDPASVEVAIAVADHAQRKGVGTALLESLLMHAHDAGLRRAIALTAPGNDGIRRLLQAVAPASITRIAHGQIEHQVDLVAFAGAGPTVRSPARRR